MDADSGVLFLDSSYYLGIGPTSNAEVSNRLDLNAAVAERRNEPRVSNLLV